jgi:hypothetical protein
VGEGVYTFCSFKDDVSASAAVSAVRPALWHILLPAERSRAVTAPARGDPYGDVINEIAHACPAELALCRLDRYHPTALPTLERNKALRTGKERVIPATADKGTRVELGPALAYKDFSGVYQLTAEPLHSESLGLRVSAVL